MVESQRTYVINFNYIAKESNCIYSQVGQINYGLGEINFARERNLLERINQRFEGEVLE